MTPYEVLGVPRNASDEAIRMAFRRAAKAFHPDLNAGDPAAEQQLKQIVAAYEILKAPQQRAMYDQSLAVLAHHGMSTWRDAVRDFTQPAVVGLASGSVIALVVWLSLPLSNGTALVAPQQHPSQSVSNLHSTADHPKSHVMSAREGEQVPASSDAAAIREFAERAPNARESEIARLKLIALIDSTEDVFLLQALRMASADEIAKRAQQRLSHLHKLTVAHDDGGVVRGNRDESNDRSPSKDLAFYLARGERWLRGGDFDRAIADFDQAIKLQPDSALAYHHRGNAWSGKGELDRALADYEAAIRLDPSNPALFRDRGVLRRHHGDLDGALVDFDHAIRLGFSDAGAYNERGLVWQDKKRHERAIADFNQALKINPNLASALVNRGIAWRSKGDFNRAIADFDAAIGMDPNMPVAYYNRALARSDKHEFDQATTDHTKARELLVNGVSAAH
jgi:tetratricopeptide (TPR) repeat protein